MVHNYHALPLGELFSSLDLIITLNLFVIIHPHYLMVPFSVTFTCHTWLPLGVNYPWLIKFLSTFPFTSLYHHPCRRNKHKFRIYLLVVCSLLFSLSFHFGQLVPLVHLVRTVVLICWRKRRPRHISLPQHFRSGCCCCCQRSCFPLKSDSSHRWLFVRCR